MGTGVRGEPRPGGPVPRGCMAAKARGFSVLGGVRVRARACQPPQFCELICVQGWESWVFVCLCVSGCRGCVSELGGKARGGGQLEIMWVPRGARVPMLGEEPMVVSSVFG